MTNQPTELGRLIDASDWSRRRLSIKMGVHWTCISKWASGQEKIPRRRVAQLSVHLEEPPSRFVGEDGFARSARTEN